MRNFLPLLALENEKVKLLATILESWSLTYVCVAGTVSTTSYVFSFHAGVVSVAKSVSVSNFIT